MDLVAKNLPFCTHRYALFVSYIGTKYNGSQRLIKREDTGQQNTIQEALEHSLLHIIPRKRCRLTACSRTDKGVHALMNVYTLPLMDEAVVPSQVLRSGMNAALVRNNHEIVVNQVVMAPADFHPRKDTESREYVYRLGVVENHKNYGLRNKHYPQELIDSLPVTELYRMLPLPRLNNAKVQEAVELLNGTHDFASFGFNIKPEEKTVREVEINFSPEHQNTISFGSSRVACYNLHFKSRAFLYNQVRRMVGAVISYAAYESVKLRDIKELLDVPSNYWNPKMVIAEPWGLFLKRINYSKYNFEVQQKIGDEENSAKYESDKEED